MVEDQRLAEAMPVEIRGATGPNESSINGVYEPNGEIRGGWPAYRKHGPPKTLLAFSNQVKASLCLIYYTTS